MRKKTKATDKGNLERIEPYVDVRDRIVVVRQLPVILDADVAALYGVETKHVNQAVRNNCDKFPADYVFALTPDEVRDLRSKFLTANPLRSKNSTLEINPKSRYAPKAFTEKGLYMLATVLKSGRATAATFAIIETFAKVRSLKRESIPNTIKIGSMKDEITLSDNFDEAFDSLDGEVASMFMGAA